MNENKSKTFLRQHLANRFLNYVYIINLPSYHSTRIIQDSKLLALVPYIIKQVETSSWVFWAEHHEPCGKKLNVPKLKSRYSSNGPNRSVDLNKRGGRTIYPKLINVWSEISMWADFSVSYLKEFCTTLLIFLGTKIQNLQENALYLLQICFYLFSAFQGITFKCAR